MVTQVITTRKRSSNDVLPAVRQRLQSEFSLTNKDLEALNLVFLSTTINPELFEPQLINAYAVTGLNPNFRGCIEFSY